MSVAATSSTSSSLALSGLASGLNWTSIINDMVAAQSAPETQMQTQQTTLQTKNTAYQTIGTDLTTLNNDVTTLTNPSLFQSVTTSSSNSSVASATAASGTALGSYTFKVTQLASDSSWQGATAKASPLSSTSDVLGVVLGSAGFSTPVTAGTFTVNGQAITVAATDTLQSVFDQINTATGDDVTASYDPSTDEISLNSSSPIVLGSDTDTSNFLQVTQLYSNGGNMVTSASALGGINLDNPMSTANLATPISDGGGGQGEFKINGVAIDFDASTDSINDVLQRINDSAAGVTATYDAANSQFQLTNTSTGAVGISMQDVTGNFLAATGLSAGTLTQGNNLEYSVDGGGTLTSESNTIDSSSSGVPGLSVTAQNTGTSTVTVQSDTSTIASAISNFVTDYNAAQTYISSQTATTTASDGTVTPGTLTGDMDVEGIATQLRELTNAAPSGLSEGVQTINDIGITSDGTDNLLTLDSSQLNATLATNLGAVQQLFTNPTNGLGTTLGSYLTNTTGSNGILSTQETSFTNQSDALATSITNLQAQISATTTNLQNEFVSMETAISTINTNKQYLSDFFSQPSTTTAAPTPANNSSSASSSSTSS
jgi:flagellar hook-associated protein 2